MPLVSKNKNNDYNDDDKDDESLSSSSNFVPVKKTDKKFVWEYNNRTAQSYIKNGLEVPFNLDSQQRTFLSKVNVDPKLDHEIRRTVTKIVKVKAIDYSSKKLERKNSCIGTKTGMVPPVTDHIEGYYKELEMEPKIGGQQNEIIGYQRSGQHIVYYVPFSKQKVDEIIEGSVGTDKDTIKYLFIDGALGYEFPYEEFVSRSYDELATMLIAPGGPKTILQKQQLEKFPERPRTTRTTTNSKTIIKTIIFYCFLDN